MRNVYNAKSSEVSGPYSHAVDGGDYVYFSGQTAMNSPNTDDMTGDIRAQTKQCFHNLLEVLEDANLQTDDVVKVNVYLTNMENLHDMNDEYTKYFNKPYPARTCIAVLALPLGAEVEIEMIAKK